MHSRIPLSIILSSVGRRHSIPHETFKAPSSSDFFRYLDSNDTRLPFHPVLNAYSYPPEEYNTYVGEDVWDKQENTSEEPLSRLVFDDVVEWVSKVFEKDWAKDGVVLCGRYVVANDCAWAVPSRSSAVFTPREVFMVMRNSSKFLRDIHTQLRCQPSGSAQAEFTIAKALAGEGAKEMRVFLPYRLTTDVHNELHLSPQLEHYAAVCQRLTDVCFPSLMSWTEEEHHENFKVILKRIQQAELLERTRRANGELLPKLKQAFMKYANNPVASTTHKPKAPKKEEDRNLILMLAVDILFEGLSLPIYILSGKMRLFFTKPTELLNQETEGDGSDVVRGQVPYLKETLGSDDDDDEADDSHCATSDGSDASNNVALSSSDLEGASDGDGYIDNDEGLLGFFRLIRDQANWNRYVDVMAGRYASASVLVRQTLNGGSGALEAARRLDPIAEGNGSVSHYCIVASDPSDLVTCRDDLKMRGLPLEFMDPQLLQANPEAMAFLQNIRDTLLKDSNEPSSS